MSWVECDFEKAKLVQGANKRIEWFDPWMGWLQVDNTLNWQWQFVRFRYDSNDYPTEQPKSKPSLFPPRALQLAGEVLAFGETKHSDEKWKRMSSKDHIDACLRHLLEHLSGNLKDSESLKLHLTHSLVRLGMALEQYVTQR